MKLQLDVTIDQHHDYYGIRLTKENPWWVEDVSSSCSCHRMTTGPTTICKFEVMHFVLSILEMIPTIHLKMIKPISPSKVRFPPWKLWRTFWLNILPLASSLPLDSLSKTHLWTPWDSFLPPKVSPGAPSAQHVGVGPDTWVCPELIPWKKYSDVFSIFMWSHLFWHSFCLPVSHMSVCA